MTVASFIADTPPSVSFDWIGQLVSTFGLPGAVLIVLGYTVRKIVLWALPHVEDMVRAHIKRQETVAESMAKLADGSLEIQRKNAETLRNMEAKMSGLCKHGTSVPT